MADNPIVDMLSHLVHINNDAEAGFRTAAENVKNSEIETLFVNCAKQHAKFAAELQTEIQRLGGSPSAAGTLGGALHRGWMDIKSALSGHSAGSMIAACETGEQSAEAAYADAADTNPTGQAHTLIERHAEQIKAFRTHLTRLAGQIRDGVEFQKNE
jgi:uncharacterized protein (TIGR02284 family)